MLTLTDIRDKYPDSILEVSYANNCICLDRLIIPEYKRKQGIGTDIMTLLTAYADSLGNYVMVSPSADFGSNLNRLKKFYKRFNFILNKGKNKLFELPLYTMYRKPIEGKKE